MKVKLVKNVPYLFGYIGKDAIVDLPDKDAEKLVEAGYAEPVEEKKVSRKHKKFSREPIDLPPPRSGEEA